MHLAMQSLATMIWRSLPPVQSRQHDLQCNWRLLLFRLVIFFPDQCGNPTSLRPFYAKLQVLITDHICACNDACVLSLHNPTPTARGFRLCCSMHHAPCWQYVHSNSAFVVTTVPTDPEFPHSCCRHCHLGTCYFTLRMPKLHSGVLAGFSTTSCTMTKTSLS